METIPLYVGFDPREAVAYTVFCQSVIEQASMPVAFIPLHAPMVKLNRPGSNAFTFSRYLVPWLCDYRGWALFVDGDMIVTTDIAQLWRQREEHAINTAMVVEKHDYRTRHAKKYIGSTLECANEDYPKKNQSSVILWNCGHFAHRALTPALIENAPPAYLHRFEWLKSEHIGQLAPGWNHLIGEDAPGSAHLHHYTLGVPGIKHYADDYASWTWHKTLLNSLACAGENAPALVQRAEDRIAIC